VTFLASFDVVEEFYAQGTLTITITVSFIMTTMLFILGIREYRSPSRMLQPIEAHA